MSYVFICFFAMEKLILFWAGDNPECQLLISQLGVCMWGGGGGGGLCSTDTLIMEPRRIPNVSDTRVGQSRVYFKEFVMYLHVMSISMLPSLCNIPGE